MLDGDERAGRRPRTVAGSRDDGPRDDGPRNDGVTSKAPSIEGALVTSDDDGMGGCD